MRSRRGAILAGLAAPAADGAAGPAARYRMLGVEPVCTPTPGPTATPTTAPPVCSTATAQGSYGAGQAFAYVAVDSTAGDQIQVSIQIAGTTYTGTQTTLQAQVVNDQFIITGTVFDAANNPRPVSFTQFLVDFIFVQITVDGAPVDGETGGANYFPFSCGVPG